MASYSGDQDDHSSYTGSVSTSEALNNATVEMQAPTQTRGQQRQTVQQQQQQQQQQQPQHHHTHRQEQRQQHATAAPPPSSYHGHQSRSFQHHPPQQQKATVIASAPSTISSSSASMPIPQQAISVESPLPPVVLRCLGDRSYEKRKNAALEVEALIKSLQESNNTAMVQSVIAVLSKDFCTSMNSNYRKGGLIGIAAAAIGLVHSSRLYLDSLLPPVLHCFDDPESRVRYYACESLYNIAKVARTSILRYFNQIFDGLTKLFADVDVDVKNGANLLDRLIKDIVTEGETFHVEQFLPLLQNYIRRTNPYIRQLLVGWITVLDSVPDISMIDYLPDFLDGLFNMLSDSNREIRQAADAALSDFLREVRLSTVVEFGPLVSILVHQCHSKERLNRLTAITWLAELIHHPYSGGDALLPYHSEVLGAIMRCLSDGEGEIRRVAGGTNDDLLALVRDTAGQFNLSPLLDALTAELMGKDDVPTKMAALRWVNMLLEKRRGDMGSFIPGLLPVLLRTLSDPSDPVVLLNLQVLSRISLARREEPDTVAIGRPIGIDEKDGEHEEDEAQFQMVLNAILKLFASDRHLLETRGSLIVRKLCVLLNAQSVYIRMADALSSYESMAGGGGPGCNDGNEVFTLEFVGTMVQTLNLILLTAAELHGLRAILADSFKAGQATVQQAHNDPNKVEDWMDNTPSVAQPPPVNTKHNPPNVFASLFRTWCHNPVATFSLCLLARAYDLSFALIKRFSELDVTVGFLMQIDKLVVLLESPIFVHLRLQLLDVEDPCHAPLLKSCYGLLMLLPQSDAFRSLNDRLATVCNLRDNLGVEPSLLDGDRMPSTVNLAGLDSDELLARFDEVVELHREARERTKQQAVQAEQGAGSGAHGGSGGGGPGGNSHVTNQVHYGRQALVGFGTGPGGGGSSNAGGGPNHHSQPHPIHNGGGPAVVPNVSTTPRAFGSPGALVASPDVRAAREGRT